MSGEQRSSYPSSGSEHYPTPGAAPTPAYPPCPYCGTEREDISKRADQVALWCGECGMIQFQGPVGNAPSVVRDA